MKEPVVTDVQYLQLMPAPVGMRAWYDNYDGTMQDDDVVALCVVQETTDDGDVWKRVCGLTAGEGGISDDRLTANFIGYTTGGREAPPEWRALLRNDPEAREVSAEMKRLAAKDRKAHLRIVRLPKPTPEAP